MNDEKLKELNKLKKEIDTLDRFLSYTGHITIILFGKKIKIRRFGWIEEKEYVVPKELYPYVTKVLWEHLIKLQKEFEEAE